MNYRIEKTLTNNIRFRRGLFGRLIPKWKSAKTIIAPTNRLRRAW